MWHQRKQSLTATLSLLLAYAGIQFSFGQELVPNGGFESGTAGWTLFVPQESQGKNCRFDTVSTSPHSGTNCLRFQSDDFARYGIGVATGFPVQPGEHYRVTAWVRGDAAAQARTKAPGFAIRLNLLQGSAAAAGGHLYIEPGNVVSRDTPAESTTGLPKEWTKVETVIEIPPGVDTVVPALFAWWSTGTIFVDDFSIQKIDGSTATPQKDAGTSGAPAPTTK